MISTTFTELLEIEIPLMLAPMGDVAGGRLAAAVTRGGGLGMIGAGYGDPGWIERELEAAGAVPVGIGFITFALDSNPDLLGEVLEFGPRTVQLSFGNPSPYVERIHAADALVVAQTQTVNDAVAAAEAGADVIVAQGQEAGGHGRPGRGTLPLVAATVDAVAPIPVLAAGGIADGRGLAAALCIGAAGVSIGTRFYATHEALADRNAHAALVRRGGDDTVRTQAFDQIRGPGWPPGFDGRAIANAMSGIDVRDLSDRELQEVNASYLDAPDDDYTIKALWAGEGVDQIRGISPAGEVARRIAIDAELVLARLGASLTGSSEAEAGN